MKVIGGIYMKITQKLEWDYEENKITCHLRNKIRSC